MDTSHGRTEERRLGDKLVEFIKEDRRSKISNAESVCFKERVLGDHLFLDPKCGSEDHY